MVCSHTLHFCLFCITSGLDPQEGQLRNGLLPTAAGFGTDPTNVGKLYLQLDGGVGSGEEVKIVPGCWRKFYENLADAVSAGGGSEKLEVKPEQAALVIKVIEAAKQSSEEQRTIPFEA